jgi:hypothetical protein
MKTQANLLKNSPNADYLRAGNHASAMISVGKGSLSPSRKKKSAEISEVSVAGALWSTIFLLPGGLEGAHLLQTGISPNATVLTAIAAFLLLLTKI